MNTRLKLLNLARWVREYFVSWGVLSFIYSLTVTYLLQPILERVFDREFALVPLWGVICALLLLPALLEHLVFPPASFRFGPLAFAPEGVFAERVWSWAGGPFTQLYLRHDLRRINTWLTVVLVVTAGSLLTPAQHALWVLISLLTTQRALYSIHRWRGLALSFLPENGASRLLWGVTASQTVQIFVAWLALGAMQVFSQEAWFKLGFGALGGAWSSAAMAMEGDSGRPWLVNFIALAAGILGGFLCYYSPYGLLAAIYLLYKMSALVAQRLHSVEHLDEDTLIP